MKASEMTNEELAKHIECGDAILREASARLRRPTPVDDDLLKMARDIDKLNAKLKVAEDALEYAKGSITRDRTNDCDHLQECGGVKGCLCEQRINNALAAIRREGGDNAH